MDCHSFSSVPLPLEPCQQRCRPQICIGTDPFHTPKELAAGLRDMFRSAGMSVGMDEPFSGSLTPILHYRHDRRVASVMLEVRRNLYEDEASGMKKADFSAVADALRDAVACAADIFSRM